VTDYIDVQDLNSQETSENLKKNSNYNHGVLTFSFKQEERPIQE
jgi:hypothetical protein